MALNILFNAPIYDIQAATLLVSGKGVNGSNVAPLIVQSEEYVDKLYVKRSRFCDNANITPEISEILRNPIPNYVLTGVTTDTFAWEASTDNGITSLNGLTDTVQTFSTGTAGTDFNVSSVGSVHTLNIPDAGPTQRGLINTSTQTVAGVKTFSSTIDGSISGNAGTVTTNANLTGPVTSVGNATSVAAQTGTGSTFVMQDTPTLTTPVIGVATGTSLDVTGQLTSTITTGTAPLVVSSTTRVSNLNVTDSATSDLSAETNALKSSTTTVNVSSGAAPSSGQVLTATGASAATWQTPSAGGGDLTGPITSVGLATSIGAQTGTGSTFVVQDTPTLTTPVIGVATGASLSVTGQLTSTITTGTAPLVVSSTTRVSNLNAATCGTADTATVASTISNTAASSGIRYLTGVPNDTTSNQALSTSTVHVNTTFNQLIIPTTSYQMVFGTTNLMNFNLAAPSATRNINFNDPGGEAYVAMSTNTGTSGHVLTSTGTNSANWAAPTGGGGTEGFSYGFENTAKAAGTTNMTLASAYYQRFAGVSIESVVLPSLDIAGRTYVFISEGTGVLTIKSNNGSTVTSLSGSNKRVMILGWNLSAPDAASAWSSIFSF